MGRSPSAFLKGAELASGLGAIFLGVGLGLLAPGWLHAIGWPLLLVGVGVHGAGMTLKHRLERRDGPTAWWENALYWACWVGLAALLAWIGWRWATGGSSGGA